MPTRAWARGVAASGNRRPARPRACHWRGVRRAAASTETTASVMVPRRQGLEQALERRARPACPGREGEAAPTQGVVRIGAEHDRCASASTAACASRAAMTGTAPPVAGVLAATWATRSRLCADAVADERSRRVDRAGQTLGPGADQRRLLPLMSPRHAAATAGRPRGRDRRRPTAAPGSHARRWRARAPTRRATTAMAAATTLAPRARSRRSPARRFRRHTTPAPSSCRAVPGRG